MHSRYATSLFTATTIFSTTIFYSHPAEAHSFDYCVSILQDAAQIVATGESKFKLKDYPEYKDYEKDCDQELEDAGLITLRQVRKDRNLALSVLNGETAQADLDKNLKKRRKDENQQREAELPQIRARICAQNDPSTAFACRPQEQDL
ncbi:MAG TPA: hypothetical protein V6D03_08240 [Candidatus Caenarcaniphilales bacterium]